MTQTPKQPKGKEASKAPREIPDDKLDKAAGGFNPQPDPPGRHGGKGI